MSITQIKDSVYFETMVCKNSAVPFYNTLNLNVKYNKREEAWSKEIGFQNALEVSGMF